jgi:hypothetical protein
VGWILLGEMRCRGDYPTPAAFTSTGHGSIFPCFIRRIFCLALRAGGFEGADHPQAQAALDWLADRQRADGHWRGATRMGPERGLNSAAAESVNGVASGGDVVETGRAAVRRFSTGVIA